MVTVISYLIPMIILFIIIAKQFSYMKSLEIKTRKSTMEITVMSIFTIVIVLMTIVLGKNMIHYLIGACAVLLFFLDIDKQGISKDGVLVIARGKELYKWNELESADISVKGNNLIVEYCGASNVKISKHEYDSKYKSDLFEILSKNNVRIK